MGVMARMNDMRAGFVSTFQVDSVWVQLRVQNM